MRVRWIAAALTLALCFSLAACGHPPVSEEQEQELPTLRIGSDDYEPYSYLDETGDFTGIDVDLAREACRRLGYRPEFHQVVWENKDQELAAGNIDCLWGSFTMTGREDLYQWAGPYLYSRQMVLVQADSDIATLADLAGKRVAVQATSKPETVFLERRNRSASQRWERCTAFLAWRRSTPPSAKALWTPSPATRGPCGRLWRILRDLGGSWTRASWFRGLGVAFPKGTNEILSAQLTAVLQEMQKDGTTKAIVEKYGSIRISFF